MTDRDRAASKARLHDRLARRYEVPIELQNSKPMVTWRRFGCNHRLLRVYLTPRGWLLVADRIRVPLEEWLNRIGDDYSLDEYRAGRVFATNARKVAGHEKLLPLNTTGWPTGTFELGCRDGAGLFELSDLIADVEDVRTTHRSNERTKVGRVV
jgi:hypothetical protein